jgi:hypothetical protein
VSDDGKGRAGRDDEAGWSTVCVALARVEAADEQRVLPEGRYDAEQSLDVSVGDGEPAVVEVPVPR